MANKTSRKHKPAASPPTVLTITLNHNGTGHLIARRGDLAALSQFTYHDLKDIFAAIQQGAAQLATAEKGVPQDIPIVPAAIEAPTTTPDNPEPPEDESSATLAEMPADVIPANPPTAQLSLL